MKYAGGGGGHRRKLVDDLEEQWHAQAAALERSRTKHARLTAVLAAVKAGVKHLQDKVAPTARRDNLVGPPRAYAWRPFTCMVYTFFFPDLIFDRLYFHVCLGKPIR